VARKKEASTKALERTPWRRWLLKMLLLLVVVAAFLGGIIFLGQWALEHIRHQDRYNVPFSEIQCTPPPGMTRAQFLDEVVYLARPVETLQLLDEDLPHKLSAAFAKHPWVEKVDGVDIKPPREVRVRLTQRQPVLAVRTSEGLIAVDRHGVRLPKDAPTSSLPIFEGDANPPKGPAGTLWGDPKVEGAARKARKAN
jgi:cell division septal protein FtsQ